MSVFVQKMNRPRCSYLMLLRLCGKSNYPHRINALSKCKISTLTQSRVHHAASIWGDLRRRSTLFSIDCAEIADERNNKKEVSKYIKENDYARNLFLNSMNYKDTVMKPCTIHVEVSNEQALEILNSDYSTMTEKQMVSAIKRLSYNISCSEESIDSLHYMKIFNELGIQIHKLDNANIMTILQHLVPFYKYLNQCSFYSKFCIIMDKECLKRFSKINYNETLLICDIMSQLLYRKSIYLSYSMKRLGNKPNKLTAHQLVQVLFLLNVCRMSPINMYELEYRLEKCADELSINELAIALLGFFKTRTKIRNVQFLNYIINRTILEIENVENVSIGALLKLIRFSMDLKEISTLLLLLKTLIPHISRFLLISVTHIAHSCARVALYDKELIDKIIAKLDSELKTARSKDIERLLFSFVILNIDSSNSIYQNIIEELRSSWYTTRADEISKYPAVVSRILGYLSVLNIYPIDLIQRVMAPSYIDKMCNSDQLYKMSSREYCVLEYGLRLEVPEYKGPFLNPDLCKYLENEILQEYLKTNTKNSKMNLFRKDVLQVCQEMFNTTSDILVIQLLPQYVLPDIVFCLDEQNRLLPSEKYLSQFIPNELKRVDKGNTENVRWIALVLAPHGLLIRRNNTPTGLLVAKIRHLSIIGYTPIMIKHINWNNHRTQQEKYDFIRKLTFRDNVKEMSGQSDI